MDFQDIPKNINSKEKKEDLLKKIQKEKLESLKEVIQDINLMIEKRKLLNKELFQDLDKIKTEIRNIIINLDTKEFETSERLKTISELRKKIIEIEELKVNEKLNLWRDISNLKKELRTFIKELREKESKQEILDELI